jgi:hypothetical protein
MSYECRSEERSRILGIISKEQDLMRKVGATGGQDLHYDRGYLRALQDIAILIEENDD